MDEGMPKFCMPSFSKAWWQEVCGVSEGTFFWQSVLASWQSTALSCGGVAAPMASCFLLRYSRASCSVSAAAPDAFSTCGLALEARPGWGLSRGTRLRAGPEDSWPPSRSAVVLLPLARFALWPLKPLCHSCSFFLRAGWAVGLSSWLGRCASFQNCSLHSVQSRKGVPSEGQVYGLVCPCPRWKMTILIRYGHFRIGPLSDSLPEVLQRMGIGPQTTCLRSLNLALPSCASWGIMQSCWSILGAWQIIYLKHLALSLSNFSSPYPSQALQPLLLISDPATLVGSFTSSKIYHAFSNQSHGLRRVTILFLFNFSPTFA